MTYVFYNSSVKYLKFFYSFYFFICETLGTDIGDLFDKKKIDFKFLSGRRIAIDAYNIIYQFLSIIRQPDGTPLVDRRGRVTSHLSGLFYRNVKLLENDIDLIYVFDGEPPIFKEKTLEVRKEIKEEAERKLKEAIEKGKIEEIKTYAQATARINEEIIEQSKRLLDAMGINVVQAPSEGEAQAAYLASAGYAYAVCSQDYDSLLFGSPRLVRNLTITGRRKLPRKDIYIEVEPEMIELNQIKEKNIDRKKLIWIGILVGTDYNEGVKGIGVKRALEIVKKANSLKEAFQLAKGEYSELIEEIENFFLNPPIIKDIHLEKKEMDEEKVMKLLCDEFDFSEERVRNALAEFKKSQKKKGQSKLEDWFSS